MRLRAAKQYARSRAAGWPPRAPGPALPGGESWRQAVARIGRFLNDLPLRWQGQRVLVIGHAATRWGLDHLIAGISLEELIEQDFGWQEGWEYQLS
jgi:broad specificity phosphatase PhoE